MSDELHDFLAGVEPCVAGLSLFQKGEIELQGVRGWWRVAAQLEEVGGRVIYWPPA